MVVCTKETNIITQEEGTWVGEEQSNKFFHGLINSSMDERKFFQRLLWAAIWWDIPLWWCASCCHSMHAWGEAFVWASSQLFRYYSIWALPPVSSSFFTHCGFFPCACHFWENQILSLCKSLLVFGSFGLADWAACLMTVHIFKLWSMTVKHSFCCFVLFPMVLF